MNTHHPVHHRRTVVKDLNLFYREAGDRSNPTLLLLHGFPASSFMFRDLMPRLADSYHLIAPDLPGFGLSEMPGRDHFAYTFDQLVHVIDAFTHQLGLDRYALYIFDYGAPVGLRLALRQPQRVTGLITQNGNAYEEGLSAGWADIRAYWADPTPPRRDAMRAFYTLDSLKYQYLHGVEDPTRVAPEAYLLDHTLLSRPGAADVQLDLLLDYRTNVALYPAFQDYLRKHQPPVLAVWGRNDPFFVPAGAHAFARDARNTRLRLFDTGHFALETHGAEIAQEILDFRAACFPSRALRQSLDSAT